METLDEKLSAAKVRHVALAAEIAQLEEETKRLHQAALEQAAGTGALATVVSVQSYFGGLPEQVSKHPEGANAIQQIMALLT